MSNDNKNNEMNFESAMRRLDEISAELEKEGVSLENALRIFRQVCALPIQNSFRCFYYRYSY